MARLLIVDDQEMMRDSLQAILQRNGHRVETARDAAAAMDMVRQASFDLIISDLKMPRMDGLAFLAELGQAGVDAPVIMMTAYATIQTAVEAMRRGAFDYIQKPFDAEEIVMLANRALEHQRLRRENEAYRTCAAGSVRRFIGSGRLMKDLLAKVEVIARSQATVLIRGESGSGKELIAQAIHGYSERSSKPFLAVNCAALSSTLLESELFGHEKGAFTGADRMRKGRFELADGGTLLLDEISEMDQKLQAKLLRVLQERAFERVGSSMTRQVDVRVLATTNRPLEQWVQEGRFREDLYYRLNVVPLMVPPLRERLEEIEELCNYFLERSAQRHGGEVKHLSHGALELLRRYRWPGNVRELENLMERASILSSRPEIAADVLGGWLRVEDLDAAPCADVAVTDMEANAPCEALGAVSTHQTVMVRLPRTCNLAEVEKIMIQQTLEKYNGHRQKTADALGIGVRTLGMKLSKWRQEECQPAGA